MGGKSKPKAPAPAPVPAPVPVSYKKEPEAEAVRRGSGRKALGAQYLQQRSRTATGSGSLGSQATLG